MSKQTTSLGRFSEKVHQDSTEGCHSHVPCQSRSLDRRLSCVDPADRIRLRVHAFVGPGRAESQQDEHESAVAVVGGRFPEHRRSAASTGWGDVPYQNHCGWRIPCDQSADSGSRGQSVGLPGETRRDDPPGVDPTTQTPADTPDAGVKGAPAQAEETKVTAETDEGAAGRRGIGCRFGSDAC